MIVIWIRPLPFCVILHPNQTKASPCALCSLSSRDWDYVPPSPSSGSITPYFCLFKLSPTLEIAVIAIWDYCLWKQSEDFVQPSCTLLMYHTPTPPDRFDKLPRLLYSQNILIASKLECMRSDKFLSPIKVRASCCIYWLLFPYVPHHWGVR